MANQAPREQKINWGLAGGGAPVVANEEAEAAQSETIRLMTANCGVGQREAKSA